jgi:hypothetical protein
MNFWIRKKLITKRRAVIEDHVGADQLLEHGKQGARPDDRTDAAARLLEVAQARRKPASSARRRPPAPAGCRHRAAGRTADRHSDDGADEAIFARSGLASVNPLLSET